MDQIKKGKRGARVKFDISFKRMVMAELFSGTITKADLQRKYSLSAGSIARWQRWYEQDQSELLPSSAMNGTDTANQNQDGSCAPDDVKALQEELRLARLKLTCLETLIEITEKELGIDIRKNAGTRWSEE